eukprot:13028899-Heterocapsa_arctica.AAC.1
MLQAEVTAAEEHLAATSFCRRVTQCSLCAFRSFRQQREVAHHVSTYHVRTMNCFCPGGAKQLRIVMALWDNDT